MRIIALGVFDLKYPPLLPRSPPPKTKQNYLLPSPKEQGACMFLQQLFLHLPLNMDEYVLNKMKLYVASTQNNTTVQERQIQELTDELEACQRFIESLQLNGRDKVKAVSQFSLDGAT